MIAGLVLALTLATSSTPCGNGPGVVVHAAWTSADHSPFGVGECTGSAWLILPDREDVEVSVPHRMREDDSEGPA